MGLAKPAWPALQRGHPLVQGLVAAYPFYEGAGTALNDVVNGGPNNLTTFSGSPSWVGGAFGGALSFDGSSYVTNGGNAVNLPGGATQAFTFGAWVKTGTFSSLACPFAFGPQPVNIGATNGNIRGLLQFNSDYYFWGNNADWDSGVAFDTDNIPHRILFAANSSTVFLFRDGKLAASGTRPAGLVNLTSGTVTLGQQHPSGGADFTGVLDGFLISTRCFSATDAAQDYFDPFAIYRSRTRFAQFVSASAPPAACAPTLSLLGVGCGIQAARAMIRNRTVGRREVVAELLGVNDE